MKKGKDRWKRRDVRVVVKPVRLAQSMRVDTFPSQALELRSDSAGRVFKDEDHDVVSRLEIRKIELNSTKDTSSTDETVAPCD